MAPLFGGSITICTILVVHHEEPFCEIILNLDQWFRRKCRLAPVSNVNVFSKIDNLSKIAIYKFYFEVVLGLDIRDW